MAQEVQNAVVKAKQREREEKVLAHWNGHCVAVDFEMRLLGHTTDKHSILNSMCPICITDFEDGQRVWRQGGRAGI